MSWIDPKKTEPIKTEPVKEVDTTENQQKFVYGGSEPTLISLVEDVNDSLGRLSKKVEDIRKSIGI